MDEREAAISQALQLPIGDGSERLRQNCAAEEREVKTTCHAFELDETQAPHGLVERAVAMIDLMGSRLAQAETDKELFCDQLEWLHRRTIDRVEKSDQADAVRGREDEIAAGFCHAGHLMDGGFRPFEPGNNANGKHEIKGCVVKFQGVDIAHPTLEVAAHSRFFRISAREFDHGRYRIDGAHAKTAVGKGD